MNYKKMLYDNLKATTILFMDIGMDFKEYAEIFEIINKEIQKTNRGMKK